MMPELKTKIKIKNNKTENRVHGLLRETSVSVVYACMYMHGAVSKSSLTVREVQVTVSTAPYAMELLACVPAAAVQL